MCSRERGRVVSRMVSRVVRFLFGDEWENVIGMDGVVSFVMLGF
jgi:hypothetical protein